MRGTPLASLLSFGGSLTDNDGSPSGAEGTFIPEASLVRPVKDGERYIKRQLLCALRSITASMIEKAKAGNTAQLKLLWQLGKLHEDATSRKKAPAETLGMLLMKEVRRREAQDRLEALALENGDAAGDKSETHE